MKNGFTILLILTSYLTSYAQDLNNYNYQYQKTCYGTGPTYYTTRQLNVYESMSTESAIGTEIPRGAAVEVTNSFFGEMGWWEVCYKGETGWVKKAYLTKKQPSQKTSIPKASNQSPTTKVIWQRIYLKNVGYFDLPPTMEIQKGKYKEFADENRKIKGFDVPQIVAQQKGLNQFGKDSYEKYARVMLETTIGATGDFEKLNFNIETYTQSDIVQLNNTFKQQMQQSFRGTDLKLIEWYPLKVEKTNGMSCIHVSYKRQLQDKPYVLVHTYIFQNNDRKHTLTLSYRLLEAGYWKTDYSTILKSFRITNIK